LPGGSTVRKIYSMQMREGLSEIAALEQIEIPSLGQLR
jgi:hypothetical protein